LRFRSPQTRLSFGGAAFAFLALITVACSSTSSNVAANNAATGATGLASTTIPASTIVSSLDPKDALTKGLAALGPNYHFTSTFVVNGAQTLAATGDRVGDASQLSITQSGATINYVILPTASYAQPEGGDWQKLDTEPATTDPITALNSPVSAGMLKDEGSKVRIRVTVLAKTLGVAADGNSDLEVVIIDGVLAEVDYGTAVKGGGFASVATIVKTLPGAQPIAAPI
jgi:hypothetical protein